MRTAFILAMTPLCFAAGSSAARYAGAEVCAACHKDIAASQNGTAMARTWRGLDTPLLPAHEQTDAARTYEIRRVHDRFVYSATLPQGSRVTLPVKVIMGGTRHGLSFLPAIDSVDGLPLERPALIEARYVYNTPHRELARSPGFPEDQPTSYEGALGRVLSPAFELKCLTCHGQPNTLGAGKQGGVLCESCHGPGMQHVESGGRVKVDDPKMEVCTQCHSGFSFQSDPLPGDLLVSSQVTALQASECYIQSGKALACTNCHDPHRDRTGAAEEQVSVKVCLSCHSGAAKERAAICPVNSADKCVSCHMPVLDQGVFRMTDHWIRVHAEQGIQAKTHEAGLRSRVPPLREFLRIMVLYEKAKAEKATNRLASGEGFSGIARSLSVDATAPGGGFVGAMWLAQMEPRLAAAAAALQYGGATQVLDMGGRWMILQRMPRDFKLDAERIFQEAVDLKLHGDARAAIAKDEQALEIYPYFLRGLIFLGITMGENGAVQKGADILKFAAGLFPRDATAPFDLGLALAGAGQIEAFRRAVDLDPDNVAIYESLGAALYSAGDWRGAIDVCRKGLAVDPLASKLYFNLGQMLAQHDDLEGAKRATALALKIDPSLVQRLSSSSR